MPKQTGWVRASGYLFLLGIIVAVLAGGLMDFIEATYIGTIHITLVVLGVIIGILGAFGIGSIGRDEKETFLIAVVALVAAGASGGILADVPMIGSYIYQMVSYIAILVLPAAVIIALEAIWKVGSTKY